ncbi:MAG TPA: OsmC family protein [Candidatus Polarisedimenticolaceae bacterium]
MSVVIDCRYEGDLHCTAVHGPSGDRIVTDAPVDNHGKGEHFSPTDLVAASIGVCALTIMGIAARPRGIDITGATVRVTKEMGATPRRHIAKLTAVFRLPARLDARERALMEQAARSCPVQASLGELTRLELVFEYA